jgi:acyl CoA:acetate/3-ketoacid CoA transferase beta subunit
VDRIYTDLAVIDVLEQGFQLVEFAPGVDYGYVAERTGAPLARIEDDPRRNDP